MMDGMGGMGGGMMPQGEMPMGEEEEPLPEGNFARLGRMISETMVSPDELANLLGPDDGYTGAEDPEIGGPPDSMGGDMGMDMGMGGSPEEESRESESQQARDDMRDMLSLRAQERMAASEEFQRKATEMNKQGR